MCVFSPSHIPNIRCITPGCMVISSFQRCYAHLPLNCSFVIQASLEVKSFTKDKALAK